MSFSTLTRGPVSTHTGLSRGWPPVTARVHLGSVFHGLFAEAECLGSKVDLNLGGTLTYTRLDPPFSALSPLESSPLIGLCWPRASLLPPTPPRPTHVGPRAGLGCCPHARSGIFSSLPTPHFGPRSLSRDPSPAVQSCALNSWGARVWRTFLATSGPLPVCASLRSLGTVPCLL